MKLTAKQFIFILMCTLLVLVIVMSSIVLSRVSGLLQLGGAGTPEPSEEPSSPSSVPESSSVVPPSSSEQETTAPHVHEFVKYKTVSPACDMQGYTLYSCSCGKNDIQDFTDPLGHKYGEATVIAATCDTDGYTERTCSRCKKAERTNPTAAEHKFSQWADIAVSTGEPAQEQRTCSACKVTEIRSLDTTQTWVIRKSVLEPKGAFTHYQIVVDLANNENDPVYEIYVGLADQNVGFDYTSTGLIVSYTANDTAANYNVLAGTKALTIYADGRVTTAEPVETPDPTPDTSEPDSGTSESQPTSQPDSQPSGSNPADDEND